MVETARLSGVEIRTASRVEAVAEDGASVQLANGQTVHADIIVGAGGLDCVLRQELFKTQNDKQEKLAPMLGFKCVPHREHVFPLQESGIDGFPAVISMGRRCVRTRSCSRYGRM